MFPGNSNDNKSVCNEGDLGSVPGLGRSPGEGHANPFLYSCLENSMDRGAWRAPVHGVQRTGHNWVMMSTTNIRGGKPLCKNVIVSISREQYYSFIITQKVFIQ